MRYSKGTMERMTTGYDSIPHPMSTRNPLFRQLKPEFQEEGNRPLMMQVVLADCPRRRRKHASR